MARTKASVKLENARRRKKFPRPPPIGECMPRSTYLMLIEDGRAKRVPCIKDRQHLWQIVFKRSGNVEMSAYSTYQSAAGYVFMGRVRPLTRRVMREFPSMVETSEANLIRAELGNGIIYGDGFGFRHDLFQTMRGALFVGG